MRKRTSILVLALVVLGAVLVQPVSAAAVYPTKPIEVIVPFTAGGTNDLLTRLVGEISKKYLGQPLVIVNKPGAGGSLGVAEALQASPDGYKLLSAPSNYFSTTVYTQKIPFDPTDLVPIANFMEYRNGLIVKGNAPYKTLNELLDYGKKNPGKLRWAHLNRGSALYMQTYLVFKKAGVQAVDVPYPGLPDCLNAVLGGHVDAAPISFGGSREHIKAGNVRYLVVYTDKRFPEAPSVPTAKELGFADAAKFKTLLSFYTHKNVPEAIRKTLYDAFKKTFDDPAFKKAFDDFGEDDYFAGPEAVKEQIQEEAKMTVPLLKEWGLYVGK
jgi:tripartite-type tricarboxylate transporter receptor subunit TctC